MPLSQMLLLRIFPKEKAPAAMALWAMTTLVAPVMGPILGGWLCDTYSWPVIFFINVPIAVVCAPIALRMLKRYETDLVRAPIDTVGLALLVVFVGALQLMLDLGKEHDWFESTEICVLAIVALVGFCAFLIWELTERHPAPGVREQPAIVAPDVAAINPQEARIRLDARRRDVNAAARPGERLGAVSCETRDDDPAAAARGASRTSASDDQLFVADRMP